MTRKQLPLPLATVIIPCFNGEKTIERTIKSVKAQTLNNLECIIVDDGSTDESKSVIVSAIKDDRRFRYIYKNNGGVATARNAGFFQSKGLYICCLDKDDAIAPTFLEVCIKALEEDRSLGLVYTGLWYIKPDGTEGLSPWPGEWNYDEALQRKNQIPTCNVARREVWERLGGQRQRYAQMGAGEEDAEMWLRVGAYGWKAKKVTDEGLFIYSWLSGQVSGNTSHNPCDYFVMHPWTKDGKHPFASYATPTRYSHAVSQYDEPVISIIIPVGPGHEEHVINALDSLEMQHYRKWEAVVVDDTGRQELERVLVSYPYARVFSTGGRRGAGAARNLGVNHARAPFLFFLDADDVLNQANAFDKMLERWNEAEAIVYSDYLDKSTWDLETAQKELGDKLLGYLPKTGQAIIKRTASTYDQARALEQPKLDLGNPKNPYYLWCTISILIPKAWHNAVGGFDESMETWEDIDYVWRLARAGYCFEKVPEPLLLYNFDTGHRREYGLPKDQESRHRHKSVIKYLRDKYKGIEPKMCNCGKRQPAATPPPVVTGEVANVAISDDDMIMVEFTPTYSGNRPLIGMTTRRKYGYNRRAGDRFLVHRADIAAQPHWFKPISDRITDIPEDKREAPEPKPIRPTPSAPERIAETVTEMRQAVAEQPFDLQSLPGINKSVARELAKVAQTRDDIMALGVDGLTDVRGIGKARAQAIVEYLSVA